MADGFIQLPASAGSKKLETEQLVVGSDTVERQKMILADETDVNGFVAVKNANPSSTAYGLTVREAPPGTITPIADVTVTSSATLIKAATPTRRALNITNMHSTVHVRWGDATVTAAQGQQLRAGMAIKILCTGAVYMISEGANVTVSVTEET